MEEWQKLLVVGVILIILAALFAMFKGITVWTVLIILLAIADIALGLYRKKLVRRIRILHQKQALQDLP